MALLEHVNITVSDAQATADWMKDVFGWHIRWQGDAMNEQGYTIHVGTDDSYVALYCPKMQTPKTDDNYTRVAALNHVAVTVSDLDAAEAKVNAAGFTAHTHADYEPGKRFYFHDQDGVEYEVVCYN